MADNEKQVLFLTNLPPFPLDNGGKMKTHASLVALQEAGYKTTLVSFTEDSEEQTRRAVDALGDLVDRSCFVRGALTSANHKRRMIAIAARSLFSPLPFGILKYQNSSMRQLIESLTSSGHYDLVYVDHLQMATYLPHLGKACEASRIILDEHNCESDIVSQKYALETSIVRKVFFCLEEKKYRKFEGEAVSSVDRVIALSSEDERSLRGLSRGCCDIRIVPIGLEDRGVRREPEPGMQLRVLFLGTLSWEPNNQGIMWFLETVVPKLRDVEIVIAGKDPQPCLCKKAAETGAKVLGYVDSVDGLYDDCDVMVVPLFMGSGQRVKILEAFSKGMPVVSTSVGAEGIECEDGVDFLMADNEDDFLGSLERLRDRAVRHQISQNARATFEEHYSLPVITSRLAEAVTF